MADELGEAFGVATEVFAAAMVWADSKLSPGPAIVGFAARAGVGVYPVAAIAEAVKIERMILINMVMLV